MKTLLLAATLVFAQTPVQTPATTLVIRSLKYNGFRGVTPDDVARRFKDRGVRVALEQVYDSAQVESACTVLQELLTEQGRKGVEVTSAVRQVPPRSVEVTFRAVAK